MSLYWQAIELALQQRYAVDVETGVITGPAGRPLTVRRCGKQQYPSVRLHVRGLPAPAYSVHAHKVVAFALWGRASFAQGIEVRHLDGNPEHNTRSNLALGTVRDNQMDKAPEVRRAAARAARAAQPRLPANTRLSDTDAAAIRAELAAARGPRGRVRRGVVKALATRFDVSASTISLIGKGRTWNA